MKRRRKEESGSSLDAARASRRSRTSEERELLRDFKKKARIRALAFPFSACKAVPQPKQRTPCSQMYNWMCTKPKRLAKRKRRTNKKDELT